MFVRAEALIKFEGEFTEIKTTAHHVLVHQIEALARWNAQDNHLDLVRVVTDEWAGKASVLRPMAMKPNWHGYQEPAVASSAAMTSITTTSWPEFWLVP